MPESTGNLIYLKKCTLAQPFKAAFIEIFVV